MAYNRTEAVDMRRMQGSAAPARRNIPNTRPRMAPKPQVVQKTKRQLRIEELISTKKATKVLVVCSILFVLLTLQIYSQVQVDELDRQLDNINQQIAVVESENTRLNMELDSIISLDKVDDYAQNVLGMVKVENYQVSYIDLSGGDAITQSGGKIQRSLWETIKMIF